MGKTVKRAVYVNGDSKGETSVWLQPGDEVPSWASDLVTNPKVFEEEEPAGLDFDSIGGNHPASSLSDLSGLSHEQLDELLYERELSTSGNKAEKVARLQEAEESVALDA